MPSVFNSIPWYVEGDRVYSIKVLGKHGTICAVDDDRQRARVMWDGDGFCSWVKYANLGALGKREL